MVNLKKDILDSLKLYHKGERSPIYSAEFERRFGIPGTKVRDIIRDLRRDGYPIGNCSKGYYYCQSRKELDALIDDLKGRALSMLKTVSMLEKNREKPGYRQLSLF